MFVVDRGCIDRSRGIECEDVKEPENGMGMLDDGDFRD